MLLRQFTGQAAALGDVLKCTDQPRRLTAFKFCRAHSPYPNALPIGAHQRELNVPALTCRDGVLDSRLNHRPGLGRIEVDRSLQRGPKTGVKPVNAAGLVRPIQRVVHQVHFPATDAGELASAVEQQHVLAQGFITLLALRDVEVRAEHRLGFAIRATGHHAAARVDPHPVAIAVTQARLGLKIRRLARKVFLECRPPQACIVRMRPAQAVVKGLGAQFLQGIAQKARTQFIETELFGA